MKLTKNELARDIRNLTNSILLACERLNEGSDAEHGYLVEKTRKLSSLVNNYEPDWDRCPACDKNHLYKSQVMNARSRYTDKYICSECGTREALEGYFWEEDLEA